MYVRTRLTLMFVAIAAALIGAFGLVVFQFTRAGALSAIKQDIRTRAEGVSRSLRIQSQEGGLGHLSFDVFMAPDTYVQYVKGDGEILDRSSNLQDTKLPFRPEQFFRDRVLADARAEIQRMARMVTQLLLMARTGTGSAAADRPVLIGDVLGDLCRQWTLRNGHLSFNWAVDDLGDAVVHANEDYLRQLFSILLDNAFKFTPDGGRVDVTAKQVGETAEVKVVDNGEGIPTEDLPRVFDRFYRGARSGEGSGLGLSIARHLVDIYGGEIDVESERGNGSRFTVTLPLVG